MHSTCITTFIQKIFALVNVKELQSTLSQKRPLILCKLSNTFVHLENFKKIYKNTPPPPKKKKL